MKRLFLAGVLLCTSMYAVDVAAKTPGLKLTAKERLVKNNVIERHLNWSEKNLKGKVKTMTRTVFTISEENEKTFDSKKSENFDAKGNLIGYTRYDQEGKTESSGKIMYDNNNNDTVSYRYEPDGLITERSVNTYDNRGNLIEQHDYDNNEAMTRKEVRKFDAEDNLTEVVFYDDKTFKEDKRWTFTYDANGFKTGGTNYDAAGKVERSHTSKVDAHGNMVEAILYKPDGKVDQKVVNKYDDKGNNTEAIVYSADGTVKGKVVIKYDDKGNKTEVTVTKGDGSLNERNSFASEFEYDQAGNIKKEAKFKMVSGKKTLVEVAESEIVYY